MNCTHARKLVRLDVGDDLTLAESQLLSQHLLLCPGCQNHRQSLLHSMAALHALRDTAPEPLPSVWPSISSTILKQTTRQTAVRRFNLQVAAVSVCSLLLAAATIVQTLQSLRPTAPTPNGVWLTTQSSPAPGGLVPSIHSVANSANAALSPNAANRRTSPTLNWPGGAQDF